MRYKSYYNFKISNLIKHKKLKYVLQIKLQKTVDFHPNILRFYGITKVESGKS
jgi:hypothetical protein